MEDIHKHMDQFVLIGQCIRVFGWSKQNCFKYKPLSIELPLQSDHHILSPLVFNQVEDLKTIFKEGDYLEMAFNQVYNHDFILVMYVLTLIFATL